MVKAAIYHNSKKTYTEDDVQAAIAYYKAGHCSNVSLVADKLDVKCSTLHNCFHFSTISGSVGRYALQIDDVGYSDNQTGATA